MITWTPFTPGYFDNPYKHLSECRLQNPVQKGVHNEWMLFRHRHIKELLKSPEFSVFNLSGYFASKEKIILGNSGSCPFLANGTRKWLMYLNGNDHLQAQLLTDAALRQIDFSGLINDALQQTIDEFAAKPEFDLADLASRLPFFVSSKMMGFDGVHSYEKLRHFSHLLAVSQDMYISKQQYNNINTEFEWCYSFLKEIMNDKTKIKKPSLVHSIIEINEKEKYFSTQDELISLFCLLFMASFETTKDSLGTMLYLLMLRPEIMDDIKNYSDVSINILAEELLRLAAPLQYTVRVNNNPFVIDNMQFDAGTKFYLCLASANRDEEIFEHPDELMPGRNYNPHLSFGGGVHSCIGAKVARLEIRNWLKPLSALLSGYQIVEGAFPKWQKTIFMRGLSSLPVKQKR